MSAGFAFPARVARRRPSLTPMIDVVFLLLVFFLVAVRFAPEGAVPLDRAGAPTPWQGAPRLVEVRPGPSVLLNGRPVEPATLADALAPLMPGADAPVVLRPGGGASLQDLVGVMERLRAAGFDRLVLVAGD
ncbi:MAG: biopolymer transporter ExbD [Rhodobacteraceae bacterium]|jgi:biopolymer transport protein ExbD|nr:biopolymer transporter ExbD [Paracoccaceae bacterium]